MRHHLPVVNNREYRRMMECPCRRSNSNVGTCGLVDLALGWRHGMHIEDCDACFALKPQSWRAHRWRRWYIEEVRKGANYDRIRSRMEVREGWRKAKPTWKKATSFLKSMKSRGLTDKVASEAVVSLRQLACFGDGQGLEKCSMLRRSKVDGEYFCGACGCGDKRLSRFKPDPDSKYTKLHYPYLECPLERFPPIGEPQ